MRNFNLISLTVRDMAFYRKLKMAADAMLSFTGNSIARQEWCRMMFCSYPPNLEQKQSSMRVCVGCNSSARRLETSCCIMSERTASLDCTRNPSATTTFGCMRPGIRVTTGMEWTGERKRSTVIERCPVQARWRRHRHAIASLAAALVPRHDQPAVDGRRSACCPAPTSPVVPSEAID